MVYFLGFFVEYYAEEENIWLCITLMSIYLLDSPGGQTVPPPLVSISSLSMSSLSTPTADLLGHLGGSLDWHRGAVLLGHRLARLLGHGLAALARNRLALLHWLLDGLLDWHLLAAVPGHALALLDWLLDRNVPARLLGNALAGLPGGVAAPLVVAAGGRGANLSKRVSGHVVFYILHLLVGGGAGGLVAGLVAGGALLLV